MLKKIFKQFLIIAAIIAICACSKDEDEPPYLYLNTGITFTSEGGTDYFSIESNCAWRITPSDGYNHQWITFSDMYGTGNKTIRVTTIPNSSSESKWVYFDVKYGPDYSNRKAFCISQKGKNSNNSNDNGNNSGNGNNNDNNSGNSGNSDNGNNSGSGTTTQQKPSAPTGVSVSNEGNSYIPDVRVRWNSVSNATNYYIYKSSSANGYYSKIGETSYASYGYSDTNAPTNGASAYYKVKAVNNAGESNFSDYAKYTAISNDAAFTPATPNVSVSGTSTISLSWTCATGNNYGNPKSYEVYKRNPETSKFELLTTTTSRSYSDRNTHPGINRYGVVAVNDAGKSSIGMGYSSEVSLAKPSSFSASKSGSYINFSWSKVTIASGYQIYYSTSAYGSYYILQQIDDASATSKSVYYPASSGTTLYFKIRAYWKSSDSIVYSDYTSYQTVKF